MIQNQTLLFSTFPQATQMHKLSPYSPGADTLQCITSPLSISWHHLSKKGHDFKTMLTYVGFDWDLPSHLVSLSNAKHLCLLSKINSTTSLPLFQKNMKQL